MNKKNEKQIVDIAEKEIQKFVKKWIKTPYAWESETDVHAELYMNIKQALHKKGFKPIKCKYESIVNAEYFDGVYCKPTTYFKKANYPDIVIYKGTDTKYKLGTERTRRCCGHVKLNILPTGVARYTRKV